MKGKPVPASDGRSLKGLLQGRDAPVHTQPICMEHEGNRMVRDGQWKLVGFFNEPWELYNVETDRSEARNLAERHPDVVQRLSNAYDQWAARVGVLPWDEAMNYNAYGGKDWVRRLLEGLKKDDSSK